MEPEILCFQQHTANNIEYFAKPCSSFGYYRGTPTLNDLSYADGYGPRIQGAEYFAEGQGASGPPEPDYSFYYLLAGIGLLGMAIALVCS